MLKTHKYFLAYPKGLFLFIGIGSALILSSGKASAVDFSLFGVLDNGPKDKDHTKGIISLENFEIRNNNGLPSPIRFTGKATQRVTPNRITILISQATFTNTEEHQSVSFTGPFATSRYHFPQGLGSLTASFNGELRPNEGSNRQNANGTERFNLIAQASTFTNNTVSVSDGAPRQEALPRKLRKSETKNGEYTAQGGTLSSQVSLTLEKDENLFFGEDGIKLVAEKTPEPTSVLSLFALGTLGAGTTLKRKLKPSQSTEKETTKVG